MDLEIDGYFGFAGGNTTDALLELQHITVVDDKARLDWSNTYDLRKTSMKNSSIKKILQDYKFLTQPNGHILVRKSSEMQSGFYK